MRTICSRKFHRCSLLARPVPGAYLTTPAAFHGHSQQRYMNSHSLEERPPDLLTGQLIIKVSGSSIRLSATPQPPSEHASCLAVIQVHSRGIADRLPGPLQPLPLTLRLQSQKSNALHVDARIPGLVAR
jgi:hypothetical protein